PCVDRATWLRRGNAWPTQDRLELAADGQHCVADLLGVKTLDRPLPEQSIPGIDARSRGDFALGALGRLAIRRGCHDQPVALLELPALRDELGRQPIEQVGVARRFAQASKVT